MEQRNWKLWVAVGLFILAGVLLAVGTASAAETAAAPVQEPAATWGAEGPAGGAHWAYLSNVSCVGSLCRGYVCASETRGGRRVAACGWVSGRNYHNGQGVWVRLAKSGSRYVIRLAKR